MLAFSVALGGCVLLPGTQSYSVRDHIDFLSEAIDADGRARENLWRQNSGGDGSDDALLRAALLQSLPNHGGYDLAAARQKLDALASKAPVSLAVASVARLRLSQLGEVAECRTEVQDLKRRLSQVVDIERRMNQNGR